MSGQVVNPPEGQAPQCLHLAPSGKRCTRLPYEDGFCAQHGPDAIGQFSITAKRRVMALLVGLAVIWPLLADLWYAIRHLHR